MKPYHQTKIYLEDKVTEKMYNKSYSINKGQINLFFKCFVEKLLMMQEELSITKRDNIIRN